MLDETTLADDLARVRRPVEAARGLPNALYTDPDAFDLERRRVFYDGWASIGFGSDAPNPGDATPVDYLGAPLLIARDRDGMLRVFENVCRHRGMILVEEARNFEGVIRCPYHSWCYSLNGKLRATPHVGGPGFNTHDAIDRDKTGLTEVRSAVFMDVVFVNLSGTAPDFDDWRRPLADRLSDFKDQAFFHGGPESGFQLEINANWKLIIENNCESYHLPWVHPGLNAYSRLEDHYHLDEPGCYSGQGTLVYNPGIAFPNFPNLPEKWDRAAEYPSFFPNTFFSVHRDHFWVASIRPDGVGRTVERVQIYYATEEAARSDAFRERREQNAAQWNSILVEDIFVTEGMQRGRTAPGFDGGVFSPVMDSPTHCFHDWVAARLAG